MELVVIDVTPLSATERSELQYHETEMDRTEAEYVKHLQAIHDNKLYREYGTFEEYCVSRRGFTANYARRILRATEVRANLESVPIGTLLPTSESQFRPLTRLDPQEQPIAWARAVETAPEGKVTAAHVEQVVREMRGEAPKEERQCPYCGANYQAAPIGGVTTCTRCGQLHAYSGPRDTATYGPLAVPVEAPDRQLLEEDAAPGMDSNEWYTPTEFIEAARRVMGAIHVDPASNDTAQEFIQAKRHYTKETNGLAQEWKGNVWLNPPYGDPLPWVEKLLAEFEAGRTKQAILLVNTANSPQWSRLLWHSLFVVCMLDRRVRFWRPDRLEAKGTAQDQMIWYIGWEVDRFRSEFEVYGVIR